MAKFDLGQRVKVVHGSGEPFTGCITEITPPKTYYRVEAQDKDGRTFAMTVEEGWLEPDEEPEDAPDVVWRRAKIPNLDTGCLAQSLTSLCFALGGTHVAGWVEEAERAAWKGMVVKYE
jgi:hypothetical protein